MSTLQIHCLKVKYKYPFHAGYNCTKTAECPFHNLNSPHINLAALYNDVPTSLGYPVIYMYDILFTQG